MWLRENRLKGKTAHFWLPSASQKRAWLTMTSFVPWLANLNIKCNVTSMFVNKKFRYCVLRVLYNVWKLSVSEFLRTILMIGSQSYAYVLKSTAEKFKCVTHGFLSH